MMEVLKTNEWGYLLMEDGSVFGKIKSSNKKGTIAPIKLKNMKVGEYIIRTGEVKDLEGNIIGIYKQNVIENSDNEIDVSKLSKAQLTAVLDHKREEKREEYCIGRDSNLIVTGQLSKMLYGDSQKKITSASDQALEAVNKKYGWKYDDWETLSKNEDLTEEFLNKYELYVDWYEYIKAHPVLEFTDKFVKKHWKHLLVRTLQIV